MKIENNYINRKSSPKNLKIEIKKFVQQQILLISQKEIMQKY
jgi:hypothetical protein